MNNDYGMMARAFAGGRQGGMQRPQQAGPYGGIMAGQPQRSPQQFGPMPGMAPRPGSGGGIMGGQPQAPRPMQQPMQQMGNFAPPNGMRRPM